MPMLNSLVNQQTLDNASRMVSDKDHKISFVRQELYKLKCHGVEKDN